MSEKRFTVPNEKDDDLYWNIIDNETGKCVLQHISLIATNEMCDLLNQLVDENEQLKFLLKDAEDQLETLKQSNKKLMESLVQKESED